MAKETKTLKENNDIRISATTYKGKNGNKEFFAEVMEQVCDLVKFYLSLKISSAFSTYHKKHGSEVTDVTFKVELCERSDARYFDNIKPSTPLSDQDFLRDAVEFVANHIANIILKSDNLYEDLLNVLLVVQNVLVLETVIYVNDEPILDDFVSHTAAIRNRTLN